MSTQILVTGGTGFLGSYIISHLVENGYSVRAIRRANKLPFWIKAEILDKVDWVEGDILDVVSLEDAMEGVDTIIHSAAAVSFLKKERANMYQVNVEGTANVVNIALEKKIRKLIHISSVAALGRSVGGGHVNEEKKWEESKVNTHYGRSKYKAELHVWRGISEGLEAVILNPSTILGYGDWNSGSSAIFRNIYHGIKWYPPGINGFVDVEDVAGAVLMMIKSGISGERFIINSENWPFKKLQDNIATGFNKKGPEKAATPFLLSAGWRTEKIKYFFTGRKPLLTRESARVAISQTYFENDKILKAFPGFKFNPLETCIQRSCAAYLSAAGHLPSPNC